MLSRDPLSDYQKSAGKLVEDRRKNAKGGLRQPRWYNEAFSLLHQNVGGLLPNIPDGIPFIGGHAISPELFNLEHLKNMGLSYLANAASSSKEV